MADERTTSDLLHWIWSCQLQLARFVNGFNSELSNEYESTLKMKKAFSRTTFDEHMAVVAVRNLLRALERTEEQAALRNALPTEDTPEAIRLLRNIREHWDQQRERFQDPSAEMVKSGKTFSEKYPGKNPWSSVLTAGGSLTLAGVVPVDELFSSLKRLEEITLELREQEEDAHNVSDTIQGT